MTATTEPAAPGLSAAAECSLRTLVHGAVVTANDPNYDDVRGLHNAAIDHHPAVVVQAGGVQDVVRTIRFAGDHGLGISVKGGGHGVGGHAMAGDVVVDLSAMRAVTVDPATRTAVVAGGATWADVDAATRPHGLAVPGGRMSRAGVGGVTLGGGEGWLSCRHGLVSDNLVSAEVVTAVGNVVTASESSAPELFWALRGGGGNFGAVTSFRFRLHPLPDPVVAGLLGYPVAAAPTVLAQLEQVVSAHPRDFGGAATFMTAPPRAYVPGDLVGTPMLWVVPVWFGDADRADEVLRPFRTGTLPLVDKVGPMSYLDLQSMLDGASPRGLRARWSAGVVESLTPTLVDAVQHAAMGAPGAHSQIRVVVLPEAVRTVPDDATAFPARSGGRWLVHAVGKWADPADDETSTCWVHAVADAVAAAGETGTYLNVEDPDEDRVRWAMGEQRYARLQRVKAAWDPDDVFRNCAHVPVPAGAR